MRDMAAIDRALHRGERFIYFILAIAIGGVWVFFESLSGKEIPSHAHPVFASLLATCLMFGGIDLRNVARIKQELARVTNSAGISPDALDDVAARIAILELQDPQVARALRALAPRRRPTTNPARRPRQPVNPAEEDEDPQ